MVKVSEAVRADGTHRGWIAMCPACRCGHLFDHRWEFSGTPERPTFDGSMLSTGPIVDGGPVVRCHSYVRDGRIEFLADCTHALAGQTVDLPDVNAACVEGDDGAPAPSSSTPPS